MKIELGDAAGWGGLVFAMISFAWHCWNEWRARRASRLATLIGDTRRQGDHVLVQLINQDVRRHIDMTCRVSLKNPAGAVLALATAYEATDLDRLSPFGERSRDLTLTFHSQGDPASTRVRLFVLGLPGPDTPFLLDVDVREAGSPRAIIRRRNWRMMGRRH